VSWHIVSEVYKAKLGSPARKAIAAKLADWVNDDGGRIFPSVQRIADETESSVRTVQYTLRAFVDEKLLIQVREGGKGPGSTSEYRFDLDALAALPRSRATDDNKGAPGAPLDDDGRVQPASKRVQPASKKGATGAPDSSREPPNEPPHTNARDARATRVCGQYASFCDERRRERPDQREVIDRLLAPLLATMPLPKEVSDPEAFLAEVADQIAARNFEITVLDRGLIRARAERSVMPSPAMFLRLLDRAASSLAAERETLERRDKPDTAHANAPTDARTAALHEQLTARIGKTRFQNWQCYELQVASVEADRLIASVANDGLRRMIAKEFDAQLEAAAGAAFGLDIIRVDIVVRDAATSRAPAEMTAETTERAVDAFRTSPPPTAPPSITTQPRVAS
jgi:hypothetical protein